MPNSSGIVPSGKSKVLMVATFEHLAPNAVDMSNSMSSRGIISVMLRSLSRFGVQLGAGPRTNRLLLRVLLREFGMSRFLLCSGRIRPEGQIESIDNGSSM